MKKVGLLGTNLTIEQNFFKDRLSQHQIETHIPAKDDKEFVHQSIFTELGKEIFLPATKERYISIINGLVDKGAQGIILGCTKILLLIKQ